MPKDYYDILGIRKNADQKKIKKAYRAAVKKHHPDAHSGDGSREKFLEAKDAYDTLSNEKSRQEHDRELERRISRDDRDRAPDLLSPQDTAYSTLNSFIPPLDEILCGFFRDIPETGLKNRGELFLEVILTVREASEGGLIPIKLPVIASCPKCSRRGRQYFSCPICRGSGRVRIERTFSLRIPPHVPNGKHFRIPLGDSILEPVFLNVSVVIDRFSEGRL